MEYLKNWLEAIFLKLDGSTMRCDRKLEKGAFDRVFGSRGNSRARSSENTAAWHEIDRSSRIFSLSTADQLPKIPSPLKCKVCARLAAEPHCSGDRVSDEA